MATVLLLSTVFNAVQMSFSLLKTFWVKVLAQ